MLLTNAAACDVRAWVVSIARPPCQRRARRTPVRALLQLAGEASAMHDQDKPRHADDKKSVEDRSKRADAGAAPEQSDQAPDVKPGEKPRDEDKDKDKDDEADPREKRQDP